MINRPFRVFSLIAATTSLFFPIVSFAQTVEVEDAQEMIEHLQLQINTLQRESQQRLEALQQQTAQQIQSLQNQITLLSTKHASAGPVGPTTEEVTQPSNSDQSQMDGRLKVSGDFRLRYENNSSYADLPSWDRGVLRARLAARYLMNDQFALGARLTTGNPDNPRTTDVTIGDFVSDFEVSLDQVYAEYQSENLLITGGKFAKPFSATGLVWDGDVNPQGLGGNYYLLKNETWSAKFSGIYFLINEEIFDKGTDMLGGQISASFRPDTDWNFSLHAAYYDYDIGILDLSKPGARRGNNVTPDGTAFVSDFHLFDAIGVISYTGLGETKDIRLVTDYVKNLGAEVPEDTGYGADLFIGNLKKPGRMQFRYGYSRVETDAVLGYFSNDNTLFATNYELHTLSLDYSLREHTFLGLIHYTYRRLDSDIDVISSDWISRTRLNLYFQF